MIRRRTMDPYKASLWPSWPGWLPVRTRSRASLPGRYCRPFPTFKLRRKSCRLSGVVIRLGQTWSLRQFTRRRNWDRTARICDWGVYQTPGAVDRMRTSACAHTTGFNLIDGAGDLVAGDVLSPLQRYFERTQRFRRPLGPPLPGETA